MRTISTRLTLCVSVIALFAASAVAAPPEGEGWESLFNGRDLSGWKVPEGDGGHWKVIDGAIDYDAQSEAAKGEKDLWSEASFGDFTLRVDWRIKQTVGLYPISIVLKDGSYKTDENGEVIKILRPSADSGILLRGKGGAQANIWPWPVGSGEVYGYRINANMPSEVRAGVTPKVCADNPVGQWNTFVITMRGDRLTVELNGKTVIERAQLPGIPEAGPIALQHHGSFNKKTGLFSGPPSLMQFRNVYVKRLK